MTMNRIFKKVAMTSLTRRGRPASCDLKQVYNFHKAKLDVNDKHSTTMRAGQ